jgi:hypothetical protein
MRIQKNSVPINTNTKNISKRENTTETNKNLMQETKELPKNSSVNQATPLVSRAFLETLAEDYKKGIIDSKEANSRFVNTVVNNSIDGRLSEKDKRELITSIADFFSQDQDFLKDLENNLTRFC